MINLIVNGNSYSYPQPGDKANTGWGSQATNWASAVTAALTALGLGGTLTPTPNAVVDISSTTKGILIPRLTTTQRNAITSPATSLLIFNTTLEVFQYYTGSAWITIGAKIPDNVQTGNGSVSAPAYSFTNDSNSGLYRISEDKIGFAANGVRQGEFGVGYGGFTGNVIQIKSINSTARGTNSTTNYSSFMTLTSFTPIYSTSDILILFTSGAGGSGASGVLLYSIFQDNTAIAQSVGATLNSTGGAYAGNTAYYSPLAASALVTAGSTVARDYSVRIASGSNGQIVAIGGRSIDNGIGAWSNLTVMEIQK